MRPLLLSFFLLATATGHANTLNLGFQLEQGPQESAIPLTVRPLTQSQRSQPLTYAFEGLPYPGEVLWRPETQQMAYRHPAEGSWLLLTSATMPAAAVALSNPGAPGPAFQQYTTRRWVQQANGKACGPLFGSATLGQATGLTLADFQQVWRLLYWLNAGETAADCANALTPAVKTADIGLPTRWATPLGTVVLKELTAAPEATETEWPAIAYPPDLETRLRLLLVQLPVSARAAFIQANANLPLAAQLELLSQQLAIAATQSAP